MQPSRAFFTGSGPSVADYILEVSARWPNCRQEILEKALVHNWHVSTYAAAHFLNRNDPRRTGRLYDGSLPLGTCPRYGLTLYFSVLRDEQTSEGSVKESFRVSAHFRAARICKQKSTTKTTRTAMKTGRRGTGPPEAREIIAGIAGRLFGGRYGIHDESVFVPLSGYLGLQDAFSTLLPDKVGGFGVSRRIQFKVLSVGADKRERRRPCFGTADENLIAAIVIRIERWIERIDVSFLGGKALRIDQINSQGPCKKSCGSETEENRKQHHFSHTALTNLD